MWLLIMEVKAGIFMNDPAFLRLIRGLRWLSIPLILAVLAACGPNPSGQGGSGGSGGNPAQNENVLNQKSGSGP
jgi:hypothetical protein